jgi:vacuolar-type H+-ATPase subunit H
MENSVKKKSVVKRILKWLGIVLLLFVLVIIAAPFIFKKQIVQFVKDQTNAQLNAKVDFGEFDLTLISSFPDFKLSIENISIANVGDFEGDTLLSCKRLAIGLNLMSVIKGDNYQINAIVLDNARIKAMVMKDGKANWDISKPSTDTASTTQPETASAFKMSLKKLEINNAYIIYDGLQAGMRAELVHFNHHLKGDFGSDNFVMETLTEVEKLSYTYAGMSYLKNVNTRIKADIDADLKQSKYTFKQNEFALNELVLGLDGFVQVGEKDMPMDLNFKTAQTEFKSILSLVPGVYTADFKDVKTSGSLALNGFLKGAYSDKSMPGFGIKLLVKDAMFQYPSLPKSANNIQIDLQLDNKTGEPDATIIDLNKFHVEMAGNPVNAVMHVSTPVSDANIDAAVQAKINLASLKDVIPMDKGDELNGKIDADIKLKGRMSSIDKKEYQKFDAHGTLGISEMTYKSSTLSYPTQIDLLSLNFTPQTVELTKFIAKVGKSDFDMNGKIENFLQYALKDSLLKGSFALKSNYIDLNQFSSSPETETTTATQDTTPMTVLEIPSNLDIKLNVSIDKMLYDKLSITSIAGGVKVNDSKLTMDNLKLSFPDLEGSMQLTGVYNAQNIKKPLVDLNVGIGNFDIPKTFAAFNSVQKLAPIAKYAKGKFSTQLSFVTELDKTMSPDLNTLTGKGKLETKSVTVEGFEPINKLADALKQEKYKKMTFDNVNASYEFKDGRVFVQEMPIKTGNITGKVKGSTGFDQTIDYLWNIEVPTSEFGSQANAAAGSLLAQLNQKAGTNVKLGDKVKLKAIFGGTVTKPTIKTDLFGSDSGAKDQVQNIVSQGVDMAKVKAREESEKIMRDAQAEADRLKSEAAVLAEKTKREGYDAIDKNIESISNPIAKVTAKAAAPRAKKEVDNQAQKILDEANKKADDILLKAKVESDKKLQ